MAVQNHVRSGRSIQQRRLSSYTCFWVDEGLGHWGSFKAEVWDRMLIGAIIQNRSFSFSESTYLHRNNYGARWWDITIAFGLSIWKDTIKPETNGVAHRSSPASHRNWERCAQALSQARKASVISDPNEKKKKSSGRWRPLSSVLY